MAFIDNQVQTLTNELLTPFSAQNINMEIFFEVIAENVRQREKEIQQKKQREKEIQEKRQREKEL